MLKVDLAGTTAPVAAGAMTTTIQVIVSRQGLVIGIVAVPLIVLVFFPRWIGVALMTISVSTCYGVLPATLQWIGVACITDFVFTI